MSEPRIFPEPVVDYRVTSRRLRWCDLPGALVDALEQALGARVLYADEPVTLGFSPAYAGPARLDDGRRVFVKAAPAESHSGDAVAREREVLAALPPAVPAAALLAGASAGGWEAEVVEHLDGHVPGLPWTSVDVERVHDALVALSAVDAMQPGLVGADLASSLGADAGNLACAHGLVDGSHAVPGWTPHRAHLGDVGRLALQAADVLTGDALQHGDLRPDNMIVTADRAVLLDWGWLERGPAWCDLVGLVPGMAADGIDVDALLARSPLTCDVDPHAIDVFLAVVTAYMLGGLHLPPLPGTTWALRHHQAWMAHTFIAELGRRRGWAA